MKLHVCFKENEPSSGKYLVILSLQNSDDTQKHTLASAGIIAKVNYLLAVGF